MVICPAVWRGCVSFALLFTLAACGGSGNDDGLNDTGAVEPPGASQPETLEESLQKLGVDTAQTARLDSQANPYPETYAPLGHIVTVRQIEAGDSDDPNAEPDYIVGRAEELFLGGFRLRSRNLMFTVVDDISLVGLTEPEARFTDPVVLEGRSSGAVPWASESGNQLPRTAHVPSGTRRHAAAADTNGDGFFDAVTAYVVEGAGGVDELRLQIMDGDDATPILDFAVLSGGGLMPAYDVRVAAIDLDGDGRDELAIAIAREPQPGAWSTPVGIYIVDDAMAGFPVIGQHIIQYEASFDAPYVTIEIQGFHADHDRRDQIALVINESQLFAPVPGNYASRFFVLELEDGELQELAGGPITAEVHTPQGPREATAVIANITTGDISGDGLDELIFGALEAVVESCRAPNEQAGVQYLLAAYGGRHNGFTPVRAGAAEVFPPCHFDSDHQPFVMRHVHVNVVDFNGDGNSEIQLNDMVLEYIPVLETDWENRLVAFIDEPSLIYGPRTERQFFDRSESAMAVSDQTGDGVQNLIAMYMDGRNDPTDTGPSSSPTIKIYEWDPEAANGYRIATRVRIELEDAFNNNPIIVAMDVDNDQIAQLRYTGEHFLDITQPVVLAAIAAPPCKRDIGQDSCYASWGKAQSGAVGREFSFRVFGSAGVGAGAAGAGAFGKWLFRLSASAATITSQSYELRKSHTFSTGPFEDGVVFTAVPVDRYIYELIRDNTDVLGPIGEWIEIRLPRSPDVRIVDRSYYNSSIVPDAEQIDERVFRHTPGDISSYPNSRDKSDILILQQQIVDDFRRGMIFRFFEYTPAKMGLEVGPVTVGQGGGATELSLEYTEAEGRENELAMAFSFEATMIFGAAIEWEVGIERGRTLSVSHGDSTLFSGSVDSIDALNYEANVYGFGLFAYLQRLGFQEIEVINFWVEE